MCTNFLNTPRALGYYDKIPGTSQAPPFQTQGRQTFEGGHELFGHHPFEWKTPIPPGGFGTQKLNLCAFCSCNNLVCLIERFLGQSLPQNTSMVARHRGLLTTATAKTALDSTHPDPVIVILAAHQLPRNSGEFQNHSKVTKKKVTFSGFPQK